MKVNETMIGDWVFVNDIEHKDPMQVTGIKKVSGEFYAELANPYDAQDHCECIVSKLFGVDITEEYLTACGFELDYSGYNITILRWTNRSDLQEIAVTIENDTGIARCAVFNDDIIYKRRLQCIHELQNACTACGLDVQWKLRDE